MKEKVLILLLCTAGVLLVSYGMYEGDNPVFLVGLFSFVTGYLLVRKKLKEPIKNESRKHYE